LLPKFNLPVQMAEDGIAYRYRCGGKIRFIESAFQECTGGQDDVTRGGTYGEG
jgi:hypothetical protein